MTKIRIEIDDNLYDQYKDLANDKAFQVTKLNKILLEKAIRQWIKDIK
jgi:hypothetical protein